MNVPVAADGMRELPGESNYRMFYISDLNLSKGPYTRIVEGIAEKMDGDAYLIINGNIAFGISTCKDFLTELSGKVDPRRIIVVPGKMEFKAGAAMYRDMVEGLRMAFLEGQMMILKDGCRNIYEAQDLLRATPDELKEELDFTSFAVLGASSFTGEKGELYEHLLYSVPSSRIVVATNIFESEYNPNWTYLCREAEAPAGMRLFTDASPAPRFFDMPSEQSATMSLVQGMRTIKPEEYRAFYTRMGMSMTYKNGRDVTVLSEGGYTMFLTFVRVFTTTVLDVNSPFKHEHSWDIFKGSMKEYGDRIIELALPYYLRVREVSALVKSIGGDGTVNGCSVNVFEDFNLFVDPGDLSVTMYVNVRGGMDISLYFPEECEKGNDIFELRSEAPKYVNRKDMRRMIQVTDAMFSVIENRIIRRWDDRVLEGAGLLELITVKDVRLKEDD